MEDTDSPQPFEPVASKAFLVVAVVGITAVVAALALGFTGIIPQGLAIAVVALAVTATTVVAWSAERAPASWTRDPDEPR